MNLLTSINNILPFLGEDMVSSIDESYNPTVSNVKARILHAAHGLLCKGWWFNTRTLTFTPDEDGHIQLPQEILTVDNAMHDGRCIDRRAGYLYDFTANTDVFLGPVVLKIREDMDFDDMPDVAQEAAMWAGGVMVYGADQGLDTTAQLLMQNMQAATAALNREHLRKQQYNTQRQGAASRLRRSIGGLYGHR